MSLKSITEVEAEIQEELRNEKMARKMKKEANRQCLSYEEMYYIEKNKARFERERQNLDAWRHNTYIKPSMTQSTASEMFNTEVVDLPSVFRILGIDSFYHEEAVRRFKINQNKMKQMLIEENARQKKELEDFIAESRVYLKKIKDEFVDSIRSTHNMMKSAAKEYNNECKELIKKRLSQSNAAKHAKEVEERAIKEMEELTKKGEEQFIEIKKDLTATLEEDMKRCRNMSKVYKANLKKMYQKEKDVVLKVLDAESNYVESLEDVVGRLENNTSALVNEIVTKRLTAAELRYARQLSKIVRMLKPNIQPDLMAKLTYSMENMTTNGEMNAFDLYNYASMNETEEDRHYT